jgi:hypothetical protein
LKNENSPFFCCVDWRGADGGIIIRTPGDVPRVYCPVMVEYGLGMVGRPLKKFVVGGPLRFVIAEKLGLAISCEKKPLVFVVVPLPPDMVDAMVVENCADAGRASTRRARSPSEVAQMRTIHLPWLGSLPLLGDFQNAPIQPYEEAAQ